MSGITEARQLLHLKTRRKAYAYNPAGLVERRDSKQENWAEKRKLGKSDKKGQEKETPLQKRRGEERQEEFKTAEAEKSNNRLEKLKRDNSEGA